MSKKSIIFLMLIFLLFSLILPGAIFAGEDVEGSSDHPLISRFQDSYIIGYESVSYDEYIIALDGIITEAVQEGETTAEHEVIRGSNKRFPAEHEKLEGVITKITYLAPEDRSSLEIFRNYEMELQNAGFEIIYQSSGDEIRHYGDWHGRKYPYELDFSRGYSRHTYLDAPENPRYLAAKLDRAEGDIYLALFVHTANRFAMAPSTGAKAKIQLDVVELAPMEEGLVSVENMEDDLSRTGKAAIYGINFEFDSSQILADSHDVLAEIAKLLLENPELRLYVVGHTDDLGSLQYNRNLSERRAESVVDFLIDNHDIASDRLISAGVGPLAPESTNKTESGRALNRRVVLVEITE
ncbi:OmpA family protein [Halanaerobium hydrogeniformans]|uniref:OmpA/MotB domain protein n=1 Tax=Halanaerobium hydrogeniformans TaxID=656519 RepID=E4RNU7_HALHG|nr:OmpA family protein [Halanaerobium hydrogeniformans]ADQ13637.1 OmpA/MotB domain protein [Halanaerobium hydrogeniformans]